MADCDTPTLSIPQLTCTADIIKWATDFVTDMQAVVDHVVGCIQDYEYPQCDICVIKDDLVNCPLTVNMIDFTDIAWDDEGGIGVLPYPPTAQLEHRYGTGITADDVGQADWGTAVVVFDEPFDTECVHVSVTATQASNASPPGCIGGSGLVQLNGIFVTSRSTTGFTVYICGDEYGCDARISFSYVAHGY